MDRCLQRSSLSKLLLLLLIMMVTHLTPEVSSSGIVSSTNVTEGSAITITCNADVLGLNSTENAYLGVTLRRKTASDPDLREATFFFLDITKYERGKGEYVKAMYNPSGSKWSFVYPTESVLKDDSKRTMGEHVTMAATTKHVRCSDAGEYKCVVMRKGGRSSSTSTKPAIWYGRSQTLTVTSCKDDEEYDQFVWPTEHNTSIRRVFQCPTSAVVVLSLVVVVVAVEWLLH